MQSVFTGPVYVVRDNIDTDQIIPAQYLNLVPTIEDEYVKLGATPCAGCRNRCIRRASCRTGSWTAIIPSSCAGGISAAGVRASMRPSRWVRRIASWCWRKVSRGFFSELRGDGRNVSLRMPGPAVRHFEERRRGDGGPGRVDGDGEGDRARRIRSSRWATCGRWWTRAGCSITRASRA